MPKYTDADGNEVELLSPEEQKELQDKVSEKKPEEKKDEEKKVEEKKVEEVPSLDEITKELSTIKQTIENKDKSEKDSWFDEQVGLVIEDEEDKKKVRQYFDLLEKREGADRKAALADALVLVTKKNINPFNGVTQYNKSSNVPVAGKEGDEVSKLTAKFNSYKLPPGFKLSK